MGCGIKRIITLNEAIQSLDIKITDENDEDITQDCQFSWSCDGVCYCDWESYDNYKKITKYLDTDFYLRILILESLGGVFLNNIETTCYSISMQESSFGYADYCEDPNLFDPYANLDCALLLQQQLADMVICMFGIPIYYFRCDPDLDSKDLTFKEFTLYNVVDCKQIKLMLEDGQMPSSNPRLTEFDFDWETDWETELSKTQFANAFGDEVYPKFGDFIYIPMMNRMWNVNAAYDEKQDGLMWRSTTWKLSLVKYEEFKNIKKNEFEDQIDNFLNKTYRNTFAMEERNEQVRQSGELQTINPRYAATNLYDVFHEDGTRRQVAYNDLQVLQHMKCHHSNVVVRNMYNFLNEDGVIVYQDGACGDSGTISFIMEMPTIVGYDKYTGKVACINEPYVGTTTKLKEFEIDIKKYSIAEFGAILFDFEISADIPSTFSTTSRVDRDVNIKRNITCNDLSIELSGEYSTYIIVYKWNKSNYTRKLTAYPWVHRKDIPVFKLKPELYNFDFDNPISITDTYYDDDEMDDVYKCTIHGYPLKMTNIKYYNASLNDEILIPELCKYTTTHESIIINDVARPLNSGRGYAVK